MTYTELQREREGLSKRAFLGLFEAKPKSQQHPQAIQFQESSPYYLDKSKIDKAIQKQLRSHYAKLLAIAYKRATGKHLSDPSKYIEPRFNYLLGRASGIQPSILKKLKKEDADVFGGWSSGARDTIEPDLIADAVDQYNANEGNFQELRTGKRWQGPPLELTVRR